MQESEMNKADSYLETQPELGASMRFAPMVRSPFGYLFCNLDLVNADFSIRLVMVEVEKGPTPTAFGRLWEPRGEVATYRSH
jgi:hypothetical protein